ncbi:MAG: DUF5063 domain-containing protein [Chromatiaceae bacterium]|nr:DUF5063 domain-containing protein [Chromatiaceae bacterium]MCP5315542.1 DUF5063 domain-containing protein [Chromatiaceae bacterium]
MHTNVNELLAIARRYCALIESIEEDARDVALGQLNALLPQLHAAMAAVGPWQEENPEDAGVDLDQRFELFSRLRRLLGDLDGYWMEYDVTPDRQEMSGSLADDLTDIYCELKNGLTRLERNHDARRTLGRWRSGFCKDWGQHVVDAERHLYALSARDRLY